MKEAAGQVRGGDLVGTFGLDEKEMGEWGEGKSSQQWN